MGIEINYETISRFVRQHGSVSIVDSAGKTRQLTCGDADTFDLIEKADRFRFTDKWYTRDEFGALLDRKMKNPNDS